MFVTGVSRGARIKSLAVLVCSAVDVNIFGASEAIRSCRPDDGKFT